MRIGLIGTEEEQLRARLYPATDFHQLATVAQRVIFQVREIDLLVFGFWRGSDLNRVIAGKAPGSVGDGPAAQHVVKGLRLSKPAAQHPDEDKTYRRDKTHSASEALLSGILSAM